MECTWTPPTPRPWVVHRVSPNKPLRYLLHRVNKRPFMTPYTHKLHPLTINIHTVVEITITHEIRRRTCKEYIIVCSRLNYVEFIVFVITVQNVIEFNWGATKYVLFLKNTIAKKSRIHAKHYLKIFEYSTSVSYMVSNLNTIV
jgi:hypothetical protein